MIDDAFYTWYYYFSWDAGVAELADAPDLGSGALRRGGSSPFIRTFQSSKEDFFWTVRRKQEYFNLFINTLY